MRFFCSVELSHSIQVELNVNTLKTEEREEELNIALEDVHYDIIGLCEVRRLGEAIIN